MKRLEYLLLIGILSSCLVIASADDVDEDDDGVTIESEKIVIIIFRYYDVENSRISSIVTLISFYRNIQSQHMNQSIRS